MNRLAKDAREEARRQQYLAAQLNHLVYHLPGPKQRLPLEDFFSGYAQTPEEKNYGLPPILAADLKFGLANKLLSQETFDMLTL